jgi:hypothetical protein
MHLQLTKISASTFEGAGRAQATIRVLQDKKTGRYLVETYLPAGMAFDPLGRFADEAEWCGSIDAARIEWKRQAALVTRYNFKRV